MAGYSCVNRGLVATCVLCMGVTLGYTLSTVAPLLAAFPHAGIVRVYTVSITAQLLAVFWHCEYSQGTSTVAWFSERLFMPTDFRPDKTQFPR